MARIHRTMGQPDEKVWNWMRHKWLVWLSVWIWILTLSSLDMSGLLARASFAEPELVVVRVYFKDWLHLNIVAEELDIWEVHHDAGFAVAAVTSSQYEWLESLGYRLEKDARGTSLLGVQAALDPRYYYFDDQYANENGRYVVGMMQRIEAGYPYLTELIDVGDAWQAGHGGHQRDIWVLRITNEDPAFGRLTTKPTFVLLAGIHAREVTAPELAIRYIKYLTEGYEGEGGYGLDPDVTWLVDHHVAYVVVMLNPDGHRVNEANTAAFHRKNMNDDECADGSFGVDLNRNHSFFWSQGGSSDYACAETYHGPAAASEPETQAFQEFFASVILDQNGDNGNDVLPSAAPDDAAGIFITLHSYGDLVLWPWGHTYSSAPNGVQLQTIGRKFAYYNGYTPGQSAGLYPTSGTSDDWTYGKFGVASFTFEVGPASPFASTSCEGFFPAYECIDTAGPGDLGSFWPENRAAFVYAHKIAPTPYLTAYGPDAVDVAVAQLQVVQGSQPQLTAMIDDTRYASSAGVEPTQQIVAAEYYVDVPPWVTSSTPISYPMTAVDGSFDGSIEEVMASVDTSNLSLGRHTLFVRGQDADGNWGAFSAVFLMVTSDVKPHTLDVAVSPARVPIVHGQAAVTATLALPGGGPAPGWIVTFATDLGQVSPSQAVSDAKGQAVTTLFAGDAPGRAQVTALAADLEAGPMAVEFYVPDGPVAGFTDNSPVCVGAVTIFTNTTVSPPQAPATSFWDFGDGATSSQMSPEHLYGSAGSFTATLTASNAGGTSAYTGIVSVESLPVAAFAYSPPLPGSARPVRFVDRSEGEAIAWDWDLGDGSTANVQNPSHTYATAGSYTVNFRVRTDCGWSKSRIQTIVVRAGEPGYRFYLPLFYAEEPL